MVFKCIKGMFKLERNFRDAFNEEAFIEKYIEECFDKYRYVVGDISSTILRLKGFSPKNEKQKNPFGAIDNYIETSCAFGCPYYVVKKIDSEEEYERLREQNTPVKETAGVLITPMEKESFDKESLILEPSRKNRPNIIIDAKRINSIPKGELPQDLKDLASSDKEVKREVKPEPEVEISTYVSASPDFDPSKKETFKKNKNNSKQSNKNNNNNNKSNNNKEAKQKKPNRDKRNKNNKKPNEA